MNRASRILVTGLSTYWGGRLAQALEAMPEVEAIIGVDNREPTRELQRTEFVKVGNQHSLIQRIVQAAAIDTVVDTRLVVNSLTTTPREAHENNVIGTMNILAACTGPGSPVRKVVFKSSTHYYGSEQDDPAFFTERMARPHPPSTPIERDIVEAETAVTEFADTHPDVCVTTLRCANVLGPSVQTAHIRMFELAAVPMILGFDPRYQFVHEDDVVHALEHAVLHDIPGVHNVAADGVLALSEVVGALGKVPLPILPPWGTAAMLAPLRRLGMRIPDEMINQMRFGRGVDNRRYKAAGFAYTKTTLEAVGQLREHLRLTRVLAGARQPYRYEREVEEFLRWSPHVRRGDDEPVAGLNRSQLAEIVDVVQHRMEHAHGPGPSVPPTRAQPARGDADPDDPEPAPAEGAQPEAPPAPDPLQGLGDEVRALTGDPGRGLADVGLAELTIEEAIATLATAEPAELSRLESGERSGPARPAVLEAIEGALRAASGSSGTSEVS
ncbi:MAG: NAD-dependent epimerase/dehydratase family protein [Solirubrobacterales bacterium]